jgi:predicted O-methyltransferase YrrM
MSLHMEFIDSLIKKFNWRIGAELGVREGDFTYYLLKRNPDLNMVAVDLWEEHSKVDRSYPHDKNYEEAMDKFLEFPDRVRVLKMLTTDAVKQFPDKYFDFIFIDASHDYESCKRDIQDWFPKIKEGGYITGHDYHPNFGVKQAVDEICKKFERGGDQNTTWVCKKENINEESLYNNKSI